MLKVDGFDDCVIGSCHRFGSDALLAYDAEKMIVQLTTQGMTQEEAQEYFDLNIRGAGGGEGTPVFIWPSSMEEAMELTEN